MMMVTSTVMMIWVSFWMLLLGCSTQYAVAFISPESTSATTSSTCSTLRLGVISKYSSRSATALNFFNFKPKSTEGTSNNSEEAYEFSGEEIEAMYEESKRKQRERERKKAERKAPADNIIISQLDQAKFGFGARIESIKCVIVGALAGGIALAPVALLHDCAWNGKSIAQWEFDTDTGALEAALFAIVYRYCIRQDTNPQLKDGVVGAFVLTRSLSRMEDLPSYCSSVPVDCGPPFGYLDWYLLWEIAVNATESAILFAAAASAMEYCFDRSYISKFPG
jgi:hypothetical protein